MKVRNFKEFQEFVSSNDILAKFGIGKMFVFGSLARGERNVKDIDLMIDDDAPDFEKLIKLRNFLEQTLEMKVDLMIKKYADPIILYRAMKDMKIV